MGQLMLLNPRSTARRRTVSRRRARNRLRARPVFRRIKNVRAITPKKRRITARRSRNFNLGNLVQSSIIPAGIGGAGALALDVAWGVLPLPDTLKTGMIAPIAKLGGAVALGFLGRKVAGPKFGDQVLVGAVTVAAYGFLKSLLQKAMPNVPLGDYDYSPLSYVQAGPFIPGGELTTPGGYFPNTPTYSGAELTTPGGYFPNAASGMGEYVSGMNEYVSGYGY